MKCFTIGAVAATVLCVLPLATADAATVKQGLYNLYDHPAGDMAPPAYGLRLVDETYTFGGAPETSTVTLDYHTTGTATPKKVINIFGTVVRNQDDSVWDLDFTYDTGVSQLTDDKVVVEGPAGDASLGNSGTLTNVDTGEVIDLQDKLRDDGLSFVLSDQDFAKSTVDEDAVFGWGWLQPDAERTPNDFLFKGQFIPGSEPAEPGTLLLMGMGLAGLGFSRRRRKQQEADEEEG